MVLNFTDADFDVTGDGRFSQEDVSAVTAGSMVPAHVDAFDFDGSGAVDAEELAIVQGVIDCGLGAGIFADADADGDADCADYALIVSNFVDGSVLGDSDYEVTFDFDLDGDNDATDRDEIRRLLSPADMAVPFGVLDFTDVLAFNVAFGAMDPAADLAVPFGVFDFSDVIAFNTAFAAGCP